MRVLIVFDHPRRGSFSGAVMDRFVTGLEAAGHRAEIADLRAEGFDPCLPEADEPDWDGPKVYSPAVLAEQARVERAEALAFVFPVWWWGLPAPTKGWIDRVWNRGWAYGGAHLTLKKARMLAVSATAPESIAERRLDVAMNTQLVEGILHRCGIADSALEFLCGSLDGDAARAAILERAEELGRRF